MSAGRRLRWVGYCRRFFGEFRCHRFFAGVRSSAGVAAEAPGGVHLGKIGQAVGPVVRAGRSSHPAQAAQFDAIALRPVPGRYATKGPSENDFQGWRAAGLAPAGMNPAARRSHFPMGPKGRAQGRPGHTGCDSWTRLRHQVVIVVSSGNGSRANWFEAARRGGRATGRRHRCIKSAG
jgi:hypothetical protein